MRKSRFSEQQIAMALRQGEAGTPVEEICRKLGISDATYFRWKKKYGGLGLSELRELRQLREENRKLKGLVADLTRAAGRHSHVSVRTGATVERLVRDDAGAVRGVAVRTDRRGAPHAVGGRVLLACGGFAADAA